MTGRTLVLSEAVSEALFRCRLDMHAIVQVIKMVKQGRRPGHRYHCVLAWSRSSDKLINRHQSVTTRPDPLLTSCDNS